VAAGVSTASRIQAAVSCGADLAIFRDQVLGLQSGDKRWMTASFTITGECYGA